MARVVVSVWSVLLVVCVGCSDGVSPLMSPVAGDRSAMSRAASLPPLAVGVHTSILAGLDNYQANGINDWGEVVGETGGDNPLFVAFHWQVQRGITQLILPGVNGSAATAVNNKGEVAVVVFLTNGSYQAARWSWNGAVHMLPLLSNWSVPDSLPNCSASAINEQNVMLGTCAVIGLGSDMVTVWTAAGRPDLVPAPGGGPLFGFVYGLSDAGIGVGEAVDASGTGVPFAGSVGGPVSYLPTTAIPNSAGGQANGINDSGAVAGYVAVRGSSCPHAVLWSPAHVLRDLGLCGEADGIDDGGVVVGAATDSLTGLSYAFVWTADSGVRRLPGATAHDYLTQVRAINRVHQVLGSAFALGGPTHNVIWTLP
jgi:uncharacterized membrane protein